MTIATAQRDDLSKLLTLVQEVCTKSSIQNLLRAAKDAGDQSIRVSGVKEQVISNLRSAIDRRTVPIDSVYQMLCSAEENGSQHIFYYRPHTPELKTKYSDGDAIAKQVLGDNWREARGFPQFHLAPTGVVWSDFRITPDKNPGDGGWTAKLYAGLERWTFIDERDAGEGRMIRTYEKSLSREIYLAKWRNFGLLELRVPRNQSTKAILESLNGLWETFIPALNIGDFDPFDLTGVSRTLIDRQSKDNAEYRLGDVHFVDEQTGTARFAPPSIEDDVMSEPSREQAIRFFDTCRELAVIWLPGSAMEEELRTTIGKIRPNEVLIASRATTEAVDYVTHRLWALAN